MIDVKFKNVQDKVILIEKCKIIVRSIIRFSETARPILRGSVTFDIFLQIGVRFDWQKYVIRKLNSLWNLTRDQRSGQYWLCIESGWANKQMI